MLDKFDFDGLKELKFWPKGTRRTDFEAQAARVCQFFGYQSVYEYSTVKLRDIHTTENTVSGRFSDSVDEKGELQSGCGFHIDIIPTAFTCPCCTKEQDANDYAAFRRGNSVITKIKCNGCKRPLSLTSPGMGEREILVREL